MSGIVGTSHSKSRFIGRSQDTAKAWVNFNGTGTVAIRGDYNVSSITDSGTGDYTVNHGIIHTTTCGVFSQGSESAANDDRTIHGYKTLTTTFRLTTNVISNNNRIDLPYIACILFGD